MPVRKIEGLRKVTMNFDEKSYEEMADLYPTVGAQKAIRELVKAHVRDVAAKRARLVENLIPEIQLED